jgi:hypothetical protein
MKTSCKIEAQPSPNLDKPQTEFDLRQMFSRCNLRQFLQVSGGSL